MAGVTSVPALPRSLSIVRNTHGGMRFESASEVTPRQAGGAQRFRRGAQLTAVVAALLLLASCGRSAPESAQTAETEVEPVAAGVQVVSELPVIEPPPTTAPPATQQVPTTAAATAPLAEPAGTYVVQSGDTLSVIADQFGVSTEALQAANGLNDVDTIQPGQELVIPAPG